MFHKEVLVLTTAFNSVSLYESIIVAETCNFMTMRKEVFERRQSQPDPSCYKIREREMEGGGRFSTI
jgi:hypothetical protein